MDLSEIESIKIYNVGPALSLSSNAIVLLKSQSIDNTSLTPKEVIDVAKLFKLHLENSKITIMTKTQEEVEINHIIEIVLEEIKLNYPYDVYPELWL